MMMHINGEDMGEFIEKYIRPRMNKECEILQIHVLNYVLMDAVRKKRE